MAVAVVALQVRPTLMGRAVTVVPAVVWDVTTLMVSLLLGRATKRALSQAAELARATMVVVRHVRASLAGVVVPAVAELEQLEVMPLAIARKVRAKWQAPAALVRPMILQAHR